MYRLAEYEALRATLRERGSVRMCIILAGLVAWGALLLALNASEFERAVTLVPFLVLAGTFEISFFIHTGVERVGRYLQVFYEDEPASGPRLSQQSRSQGQSMGEGLSTSVGQPGRPEPVESRSDSKEPALSERPSTGSGRPEHAEGRSEWKGWENTVMAYGRNNPGGLDPLFITLFVSIAAVNFFGSFPPAARHPGWLAISLVAHLIFGWRLVTARRLSANQRVVDLERFRALKNPPSSN